MDMTTNPDPAGETYHPSILGLGHLLRSGIPSDCDDWYVRPNDAFALEISELRHEFQTPHYRHLNVRQYHSERKFDLSGRCPWANPEMRFYYMIETFLAVICDTHSVAQAHELSCQYALICQIVLILF